MCFLKKLWKTKNNFIKQSCSYAVPRERIELSWGCPRTILSRLRLPIPPPRHISRIVNIFYTNLCRKSIFINYFFMLK